MSTDNLKLSSALVLKLREYNFNNDQMISFALSLNQFIDINKLSDLMKDEEQISFNYDIHTKTFELLDPTGVMGAVERLIKLD